MEENAIQVKSGVMINADASVKSIILALYYKHYIIFGILLHVVVKMEYISFTKYYRRFSNYVQ